MHFDPINRKWLLVLLVTLIPALLGAIMPVTLSESAKRPRRSHHQLKLWNEALAKHQFAYAGYFFTINFAARFPPDVMVWIQPFIQAGILLSFAFYFFCIHSLVAQDAIIEKFHGAASCGPGCTYALELLDSMRLCVGKLIMTVILLGMAVSAALWATT